MRTSSSLTVTSSPVSTPTPSTDLTTDWQIYKSEKYAFEFRFPKDWELKLTNGEVSVIELRPKSWQEIKDSIMEPFEPGAGIVCRYIISDYPLTIIINDSKFSQLLSSAGIRKLEEDQSGLKRGTWVIPGRQLILTEAQEAIIGGQKTIRGQRLVGMSYKETKSCGGGYAGLGEMEEVYLSTPQDRYSINLRLIAEARSYIELFDQILSTFEFTN